MQRRKFIENIIFGSTIMSVPLSITGCNYDSKKIQFGVCADVHKDVIHDANFRLSEFIESAKESDLDFIIQLGDFCRPVDSNKSFIDRWKRFPGPRYHVLGNHDIDEGFTREQTLSFWGAEKKYYSFDSGDFHFVVLDGNEKNPFEDQVQGYPRYIGKEQQEWLRQDLLSVEKPVIVFSHQSLDHEDGIENRQEIRKILTNANAEAGFTKVIACFSGHHHSDYYVKAQGIYYIQINSMSYKWVGGDYQTIRYSQEVNKKYPLIKYTIPYKEPLFAFVTIKDGKMEIRGRRTEFVGPGPDELGIVKSVISPIVPYISDNKILFT